MDNMNKEHKKEYMKEYRQRLEVKEHKKEYDKKYQQRPKVQERQKYWHTIKFWHNQPEILEQIRKEIMEEEK
jgi:hypothetical protein